MGNPNRPGSFDQHVEKKQKSRENQPTTPIDSKWSISAGLVSEVMGSMRLRGRESGKVPLGLANPN